MQNYPGPPVGEDQAKWTVRRECEQTRSKQPGRRKRPARTIGGPAASSASPWDRPRSQPSPRVWWGC